jgi:hypothetical protein
LEQKVYKIGKRAKTQKKKSGRNGVVKQWIKRKKESNAKSLECSNPMI